jgi:hypothetical protein
MAEVGKVRWRGKRPQLGRRRLKLTSKTDPSFALLADRRGIPEQAVSTSCSGPVSPSPTGRFGKIQSETGSGKAAGSGGIWSPSSPMLSL